MSNLDGNDNYTYVDESVPMDIDVPMPNNTDDKPNENPLPKENPLPNYKYENSEEVNNDDENSSESSDDGGFPYCLKQIDIDELEDMNDSEITKLFYNVFGFTPKVYSREECIENLYVEYYQNPGD